MNKREQFITNYETVEGIELEPKNINRNEALRFIAKIFLNSFWGKLAQRSNLPVTEIVNTYDQYIKLLTDQSKQIKGEVMV